MKSGLEDRNNFLSAPVVGAGLVVSMKSGLEDRNNGHEVYVAEGCIKVSQ